MEEIYKFFWMVLFSFLIAARVEAIRRKNLGKPIFWNEKKKKPPVSSNVKKPKKPEKTQENPKVKPMSTGTKSEALQ